MEVSLQEAEARFPELVAAAEAGERVVITRKGRPAVELVRSARRGGVDFDKLAKARQRLGLGEDGLGWPAALDDPAPSRRTLGIEGSGV